MYNRKIEEIKNNCDVIKADSESIDGHINDIINTIRASGLDFEFSKTINDNCFSWKSCLSKDGIKWDLFCNQKQIMKYDASERLTLMWGVQEFFQDFVNIISDISRNLQEETTP